MSDRLLFTAEFEPEPGNCEDAPLAAAPERLVAIVAACLGGGAVLVVIGLLIAIGVL